MNSWIVDRDQVVQNQTIRLNGTLDIRGGTLTLRNVALEINATQASNWLSGAVVAIQIAPGAGLAISGSRITATSGAPGVVAGDRATSVAADSTCFNHLGVDFMGVGALRFHHNEFVLTGSDNIVVMTIFNSTGAEVEDNSIQFALDPHAASAPHGADGIYFFSTHDSTILRNSITGAVNGISLWGSWNNHVAGNTWKGQMALSGFDAQAANWWSISIPGWSGEAGISLDHWSNNNIVEKNTLMGAHSAILFVKQSANNTISQNTITGAGYGITLRWASHTLVDGNQLTDVYDNAIHAHRSHDNTITNNRIYKAGGGVALFASESNSIKSNAIADSDRGIFLHESAKNTIDGNTISGAVQGVFVSSFSTGNGVTSNNIIASDYPAWDEGQNNSWKGNFWGAVSGSQRAIPPAAAADSAPATAMMPLAAAPVVPLVPLPFKAPLDTVTTIQNQQVWQDARTINGSIVIESGGSLALKGATLTYVVPNPTTDIWIHVKPGGTLTIEDSKIIGPDWDHTLSIKVYKGAKFSMKRSEIRNAGSWVGTFAAAIANEADDVNIEDSTFVNVYCAYSSEGPLLNLRFVNNTVTGAVKALALIGVHAGAVVTGNRISRYGEWGVDLWPFPGYALSHVTDNAFSDSWGPAIYNEYNAGGYEVARNTYSGVKGPGMLVAEESAMTESRQLHAVSTSISPAQGGDALEPIVTLGYVMTGPMLDNSAPHVFSMTLSANGKPIQTRNIALPFGHFERIKLSAVAGEPGPYTISIASPTQQSPLVSVSRSDLRFTAAPGSQPPPQVALVSNPGFNFAQWVWSAAPDSTWLHVAPNAGANQGELFVTADAAGLAAGVYTGKIQVSGPGQTPQSINVTLSVVPGVPMVVAKPSVLSFAQASGGPPPQSVALSLAPGAFAFPFSVSARTEHGGNWLSATAALSSLPASLTVSVDPSGLAPGQYVGEVMISTAGAANTPLAIPVTLVVPFTGPSVAIGSVVNGASFLPGFAASSWFTITGANLSRTTRTWSADDFVQGRLPDSLDGVRVTIDGRPSFLCYVSPTQLNVLAPFASDTTSDSTAAIAVTAPDGTAQATALKRRFAPGVFVFGGKNAAAVHSDGAPVCAAGSIPGIACRPAAPHEVIELYATGLGTNLDPAPPDGSVIQGPSTLRDTIGVTIGGKPCVVQYKGLVSAGLYQINLEVPDISAGDQAVVLSIGGVYSQPGPVITVVQ